ncbi:MAG TPA: formate dehydrogenase accessory sulfurtransferase FdhD [Aromatoleum sp.]|uniref:formate dehydrogenase accessory sulfurtransferase FdhD n=1 Tax=Aromatoleum sp. TaxID=2307007 RepID=UPI002B48B312|nr:formate dehydrogenase accessory sulfurtransferase FdhD [Aromatoleum sp.]HJV25868.1 formate dehydrogenase accessory sulfurtransferase FdhD [Aromatoleum sp.]
MNAQAKVEACPVLDAAPWPARATVLACRLLDGEVLASVENVIEEVPVALVYNGISHAVMLASPADLEDFALGFSLSEGILQTPGELYDCEVVHGASGIEVRLDIATERMFGLKERRRNLAGRTGCGLCGVDSLDAAVRTPAPVAPRSAVRASAIQRALTELGTWQPLHRATGAAHAAAWADNEGKLQLVREDVGRHNALDKLAGALATRRINPATGFALVTSRASYEMVQKAASAGIGVLAAISAPTAYAVRVADAAHVTLIGLARPGRLTAYTHPDQLIGT